ncbi:MAG: XRE family transcriptional regulator [Gaiellales bacterium]|nr:MAG: XRE family transcriptional regulator [Gaiellales bacterium]
MLMKAQLVTQIKTILKRKGISHAQAAELLGMREARISALFKGRFDRISDHRLMDCLARLGNDVQITVKPTPKSRCQGRVSVMFL